MRRGHLRCSLRSGMKGIVAAVAGADQPLGVSGSALPGARSSLPSAGRGGRGGSSARRLLDRSTRTRPESGSYLPARPVRAAPDRCLWLSRIVCCAATRTTRRWWREPCRSSASARTTVPDPSTQTSEPARHEGLPKSLVAGGHRPGVAAPRSSGPTLRLGRLRVHAGCGSAHPERTKTRPRERAHGDHRRLGDSARRIEAV